MIQLWCNKMKGPVFVTMFNPLLTVMVAILAYVVLGEHLYAGSVIGGVLVILGLYMLLWGKDRDQEQQHSISISEGKAEHGSDEMDCCEKQQATVGSDHFAERDDKAPEATATIKPN